MIDPLAISLVTAVTALVASLTGPLVTLHVGRSQIRAAVRSANRQRWIEEFRELISGFAGHFAAAVQVRDKVIEGGRRQFGQLVSTATKIRLLVNPLAAEHVELVREIDELLDRFRRADADHDMAQDGEATFRRVVKISLGIVREEWLRVQRGL